MTQVLPCLRVINDLLEPDADTNYLTELFSQQSLRASMIIDLTKTLHDRMRTHKHLFKSPKQVEWALELLGYSFLAPQYQYIKDDRHYLESVLAVYEYILCGQVDLEHEGKPVEFHNIDMTLDYKEPHHQRIMLKMLCHMTLLFDEKNFEKRFNPLNGDVKNVEEDVKTPVRLCGFALKIYHKFLYKAYPFLLQEHWVTLIKVLIGLARFLLEPQYKVKLPDKINIAVVELLYNTWILSGIQDEELWSVFKTNIHRLIHRGNVASYWAEVAVELTAKLLTDQKCFETPTLFIQNDKKQMEFQKNLLIIYHAQQSSLGDIEFNQKSKCLLPQPFIFRISRKQTIYLWSKMIALIQNGNFHSEPKTHSLVLKGVSSIISLLLKTGVPYKANSASDRHRSNTKQARKITIKHDFEYFKRTLKDLLLYDKVRPKGNHAVDIAPELETLTDIGGLTPSETNSCPTEVESPVLRRLKSAKERSKIFDFPQESGVYVKNNKAPSADFLLKLFGKLLFEALDSSLTSSEEVRVTSITTLCQIFTKARGPFSNVYLKKFYRTYLQYLKEENFSNTLQTLLKHSCHLFKSITTLDSIIIQIPLLKKLLNYYYNGGKSEVFMQDSTLRGPSNKLYSSLICPLMNNSLFIDQAYSQERNITDILHDLLNHALQRDKEALLCGRHFARTLAKETKNLARSSWNFMVYSFARKKISPFIANINDLWLDKSLPILNKLTLDVFQSLAELCLSNVHTFKSDDSVNDTAFAGFMIIEKLNTFLQQRLPQPNEAKKPTSLTSLDNDEARNLASLALLALYTWTLVLLYFKNRLSFINRKEFYSMFTSTMATLQAFASQDPFSYHVQNILDIISGNLGSLNCTRNLPFTGSILINSDEHGETEFFSKVSKELEEQSLIHLAPNEDTILSFYDFNVTSADESLVIMVRNIAGKSIWSGNLFYKFPHPNTEKDLPSKDQSPVANHGLQDIKAQFSRLSLARREKLESERESQRESLRTDEETQDKPGLTPRGSIQQVSAADLRKAMEAQFDEEEEYEEQFLKREVEKLDRSSRARSESAPVKVFDRAEVTGDKERTAKINSVKLLLGNAGLLSIQNIENLIYIPKSKETFDWFNQIDQIPTRTQIQANLLYVTDTGIDSLQELNDQDNIFNDFVDDLGLIINAETLETGAFETVREYVNQYKKIIYASNVLYEFIFAVPNLLSSEIPEKKIFENVPINIIWNARAADPHDKATPLIINKLNIKDCRTAIVITPLLNGSYLIDVLKQESTFCLFPQLKGFVCGRDILPSIIIQAVTSLYREYQVYSEQLSYLDVSLGNLAQRKKNMSSLVAHYKSRSDSGEVLKALLGSTRIDLDSPTYKKGV